MSDTTYDSKCGFDLGTGEAPAGVNADAKAYEKAPPGTHLMEVTDFDVALDQEFKWDGQSCRSGELRPKMAIVGGPHDGATAMDWLPMPYAGCTLLPGVANRWVNFVQAFGFELPKAVDAATGKPRVTTLVPPGFKLQDIIGKRGMVKVVQQMTNDTPPQIKLSKQGEPMTKPVFFGYSRPTNGKPASPTAAPTTTATKPIPSEPSAVPDGAADKFEDL
jgi:hypothetical protein